MPETLTDAQKVLRNDTGKRIAVALEALASEVEPSTVIAPEYDETQTYAVGDLVIYRSVLYRCTTAITTPEEWTAAHWTATSVSDAYRQAIDQNVIDANLMALGLTGASVGDLVRVASVDANGKPTSWNRVPLCDIVTNENLVDDWYFAGGGSHHGAGIFPINQRGKGSYEPNLAGAYTIDRWKMGLATGTLGLHVASMSGTNNFLLEQKIDKQFDQLKGKDVTVSVITSQGLFSATGTFPDEVPSAATQYATATIKANGSNVGYADVQVRANGDVYMRLRAYNGNTVYFVAAKLELGTKQTLAHWDGTKWAPNEIPDYGQELLKCQRYYQRYGNTQAYRVFALGYMQSATSARFFLPLSVPMVSKPTIAVTGLLYFNYGSDSTRVTLSFDQNAVNSFDDHQVFVIATTDSAIAIGTVGEIMSQNTTNDLIELSSE